MLNEHRKREGEDLRWIWEKLEMDEAQEQTLLKTGGLEVVAVVKLKPPTWGLEVRGYIESGSAELPDKFLYLRFERGGGRRFGLYFDPIDVECRQIWPHLAEDIVARLGEISVSPTRQFVAVLKDWRKFWPKDDLSGISQLFLQGLFGELWMLKWMIDSGLPAEFVVRSWKGPYKRHHDFQCGGAHIEVKSKSGRGRKIWISDLRQLDESGTSRLFLSFLRLTSVNTSKDSIGELVKQVESIVPGHERGRFMRLLAESRWFQIPMEVREQTCFKVDPPQFFGVGPGFPRLVAVGEGPKAPFPPKDVTIERYQIEVPMKDGEFSVDVGEVIGTIEQHIGS